MGRFERMHESDSDDKDEQVKQEWMLYAARVFARIALHPLEYAKVLIQIGYEPIPPRHGRTVFGQPAMVLPNIFQYAGYIRRVDGIQGCYRGLSPRLLGAVVATYGSTKIADLAGLPPVTAELQEEAQKCDELMYKNFDRSLKRELIVQTTEIIISQPFHVVSLRMMAQFVGRERTYTTVWGSVKEIISEEGIGGLFSGLYPKLIADLSCVVLSHTITYILNKYLIKDPVGQAYCATFTGFVLQSVFYPFQVVSTCMAVSGSSLLAGRPPQMPRYVNWRDCWSHLSSTGGLKRGSSLFWRYHRIVNVKSNQSLALPEIPKIK